MCSTNCKSLVFDLCSLIKMVGPELIFGGLTGLESSIGCQILGDKANCFFKNTVCPGGPTGPGGPGGPSLP